MLFYIYSDAPSSTIDITSRCRVGRLSVKDNAEEGSVAISNLIVDDPDGDLELTGHRRIYIYESDAPILNQVIFNGFVVNERVERGPYRTGAGRQWVVDLADPNVFINRRIMNGADANRPAETDLARIQALLTMTELNTVDDDTYVNTTAATTAMDACDYRGQNVGAYIDDCRQASGKNGYILYNETLGQYGLWYDFDYSDQYDSGCFLTNTASEANHSTVLLYSQERTYLNADPSRVASGIYLQYDGGTVYVQDSDTTDEFAAIDWAAPSINVKSLAMATARANRYLEDAATEDYIVHTILTKVPRANVNKIKKGQLVQFKSTYMTPYTSYTIFRVLYRTVTEISEDPQASFEIEMDLTPIPIPCTPPDAHQFFGVQTYDGFMFELANAGAPTDSGSRNEQAPTTTQDTVDLTGAGMIMAGFVWDAELTSCNLDDTPTSGDLTFDYSYCNGSAPQYVIGHALVGSGTHSGNVSYSPRPNDYGGWASSAAVFPARGGTPTIVQSVHTSSSGDYLNISFASPTTPGSIVVIFLTERNRSSPFIQPTMTPITAGWTGLAEVKTPPVSGPVSRQLRMMWYICE